MNFAEFTKGLNERDLNEISSGFKANVTSVNVHGPSSFYRFIGLNGHDKPNEIYGHWWFSEQTFNDFDTRAKRLDVPFSKYAKARLALPDAWNSKLHIYKLVLPEGITIPALKGKGRGQKESYKDEHNKHQFHANVSLIGGDDQYYFKVPDIQKFPVSQIVKH